LAPSGIAVVGSVCSLKSYNPLPRYTSAPYHLYRAATGQMFLNEFRGLYTDGCETRNSDKRWKKHRASDRYASCLAKTARGVPRWEQRQTWLRRVECGPLTQTFLTDVRISFLAASHSQQKLQDKLDAQ